MNIDEIEQQIQQIEEILPKLKDIVSDMKLCNNDTTKQILAAAIKKYANPLVEFKI